MRNDAQLERRLSVLRKLIGYAQAMLATVREVSPTNHEIESLEDTIADGVYLLKELGGCAIR